MGKWGSEEETNIPLFSLMRKIFIVQFHSLLKCSLIFTMGNILSQLSEDDVKIFVAEMQYIMRF